MLYLSSITDATVDVFATYQQKKYCLVLFFNYLRWIIVSWPVDELVLRIKKNHGFPCIDLAKTLKSLC